MKLTAYSAVAAAVLFAGCATPGTDACNITPPEKISGDQSAAVDAAADLTAFSKLPVKGEFKADLKNKFDVTFQKVSDANARCKMLTQLAACYKGQEERKQVLDLIASSKACG